MTAETGLTARFALALLWGHHNMVVGALNLVVAYVLVKVESGKDQEVLEKVKKLPGVRNVAPTYGMYDLHVEATFETMEALDNFIFDEIRRVAGIKETVTLIVPKGI
jgi:DNA-binding Lrp family transcriptional regulator